MPDALFDFQRHLVEWAVRIGRDAVFADCGLGKTPMQLTWAENIARKADGRVLVLTPLAVGAQTVREGVKFGVECGRSRDGSLPAERIVVANYEMLEHFQAPDFVGVVCDESSILKHFGGTTQKRVARFMSHVPYRLLCTATPAPNDYVELGTSSEALGNLGHSDMLSRFFRQTDNKTKYRMDDVRAHHAKMRQGGSHFAKLAFRASQQIGQWRLKAHAEIPFWRWVASWAKACRKPSDLGFEDGGFILPPFTENHHVVKARTPGAGKLFVTSAVGLGAEREERRRTLVERCEKVAELAAHKNPVIVWTHLNAEADRLEKIIPGAVQVAGANSDAEKEKRLLGFIDGSIRVLITKPKIAGFGLNMQHCAHVITFVTHSYESYYQAVRRCWRFGQKKPVRVDVISTEGESRVAENMARKSEQAAAMFDRILAHMKSAGGVRSTREEVQEEVPQWL